MEESTRNILILAGFAVLLFGIVALASSGAGKTGFSFGKGKAAIISLQGAITSTSGGAFGSSTITPEKVRELNERAVKSGADSIIYEINSGGGAVVASKDIMREIQSVGVPTVCRFRDVAASGAYLVSLGCNRTVADSATITGSIGVKSSYLEFSGLLDKLGIEYVNVTAGELKGIGSPYQNATEKERQLLQQKADIIHRQFVKLVERRRGLNSTQVDQVRSGEIFLGSEAKRLGLVDYLGGRKKAVNVAENLTGKKLRVRKFERRRGVSLLSLFGVDSFLSSGNSPLKARLG